MKTKIAGLGKLLLIPVFAMALAGGSAAIVASHGDAHRSAEGTKHAKNASAPNTPVVTASPNVSPSPSGSPEAENSTPRFHGDATSCPMPQGVTLSGNWTHGDYVSAWAATGDHDKTLTAARSDCGKPMSAVDPSASPSPSASAAANADDASENEQGDQNESDHGEQHDQGHGHGNDQSGSASSGG